MSEVQNFTPKSRHLATEKNSQNAKIWAVTLRKQSRQPLYHGSQQSTFQQSLWEGQHRVLELACVSASEGAAARRELNKDREPGHVPEPVPGSTDGALTFSSPFPAQTGVWFGFLCMQ